MTKMTKRFVAGMLSSAFVLSLGMSAFAADNTVVSTPDENGNYKADVTVTVTTEVPTINVTLPTTADITINPYKMEVEVDGEKYSSSIISPEYTITNESDCAISISATGAVVVPDTSNAVLATSALKGTESTNSVFLYLETTATTGTYADKFDSKSPNMMALTTKSTTKEAIVTMAAGDSAATNAYYMIKGDAASTPDTPWAATDTVNVTLSFKIDPVAAAAASGT